MKKLLFVVALLWVVSPARAFVGFFTGSDNQAGLLNYRKPTLVYVNASTVAVQNNTSTTNQSKVIFPDGNVRSVTENSGTVKRYRFMDLTQSATFTACGQNFERSGIYSGLTEATSTWYMIYAVKSQCTNGSENFVTVASSVTPFSVANLTLLDSQFGSNAWVYLGAIINGSAAGDSNTANIATFTQTGNTTILSNNVIMQESGNKGFTGVILSSEAAGAGYTHTTGIVLPAVPNHILNGLVTVVQEAPGAAYYVRDNLYTTPNNYFHRGSGLTTTILPSVDLSYGINTSVGAGASLRILLRGWVDQALGINTTP